MQGRENNIGTFSGRILGGKYLVGEELGKGGFGAVYGAVQRDLGRPVAIKILHGDLSPDAVMRFEREARAAAALGHPNIVGVTDFSAQPGEPPFLVMELLPRETMGAVLRRQGRRSSSATSRPSSIRPSTSSSSGCSSSTRRAT